MDNLPSFLDYKREGLPCPICGSPTGSDTSWRWNGTAWEHKCPELHPYLGHMVITGDERKGEDMTINPNDSGIIERGENYEVWSSETDVLINEHEQLVSTLNLVVNAYRRKHDLPAAIALAERLLKEISGEENG